MGDENANLEYNAKSVGEMALRQHVLSAANHEGSRGEIFTGGGCLRDLVVMHPPGVSNDLRRPCVTQGNGHLSRLDQRLHWWLWGRP